jgi:hypothetical protein
MKQSNIQDRLKGPDEIERALTLLGASLEARDAGPFDLAVIGGAALAVLGLSFRPTRDVDVLALVQADGSGGIRLASSRPLPQVLLDAAAETALALGIGDDWLNDGPTDLLEHGLPTGFEARLTRRSYGPRLVVWYAARQDLVALKTYAAADLGEGRHLEDLQALAPSREELMAAARWARTHDPSMAFGSQLSSLLAFMGCGDSVKEVFDD